MNVEYSAIAAKLRAMYSKFLTKEDYGELLTKKSVNDICAYMKSTAGYGEALSGVSERSIHRGEMELLLYSEIMNEYVRIYNFIDHTKRKLIEFWFMRQEVEFLKREIRHIYTHEERSSDEVNQGRFDAFFKTHTKINRDIMSGAKSLSDCIEACANTPYSEPLKRAESLGADLFSIGMMLDSHYYSAVWRTIGRNLKGEQEELFRKLLGSEIDMLNLMWIYRGKKYFDFPNEIIFTYLLPVRYRLTEDTVKQLVNTDGAARFTELAAELTSYGRLFENCDNGIFPEENFRYLFSGYSRNIFVNHTESLAAIYAYLNLKEVEFDNITTITEGIRYSLNSESIRKHIGIQ